MYSPIDENRINEVSKNFDLPVALSGLLISRGVSNIEQFLNPSIKEQMPDPFVMRDMDMAIGCIVNAVRDGKKLSVFGDYDVDGITSTANMVRYFRDLGINDILWHLPSRDGEGYGLNINAIDDLYARGARVLITVDCGISAVNEVSHAKSLGMDVVILDHHEPEDILPSADAVVDPKRHDDESGLTYLAGVGVSFLFLVGLNRALRESGFFDDRDEPKLMESLDLVALGTVCDTMPLIGLNRAFVATGLRVLEGRKNIGLRALMEVSNVKSISVYVLGFVLGPRLNAAGRLTSADKSLELLLCDDMRVARELATDLTSLNEQRKDIESGTLMHAIEMIESNPDAFDPFIFLCDENWHGGVMGIIAGRLKDRYYRPTCVATKSADGTINGSGRSIPEVDLGRIILDAMSAGLLVEGGGHSAAAGFTLHESMADKFIEFVRIQVKKQLGEICLKPLIKIDVLMDAGGASMSLVRSFSRLEPFGQDNSEPTFALTGAMLSWANIVGHGHVRAAFKTSAGTTVQVIGFNLADTPVGQFLLDESNVGRAVTLCGKLKENEHMGRTSVQLILEDVCA